MEYTIRTEQFEGPLEVLLKMIESHELDITRLSLANVADQFVEYVETNEMIPLEQLADFLSVASRLLLLKSRALLPVLDVEEESEEESVDLEWQLREYKKFKDIAEYLQERYVSDKKLFRREGYVNAKEFIEQPTVRYSFTVSQMHALIRNVIERIPDIGELKKKIIRRVVSLEERVRYIKTIIARTMKGTFSECIQDREDKDHITVSFLAVLELSRSRHIEAKQERHFGEIFLEKRKYTK